MSGRKIDEHGKARQDSTRPKPFSDRELEWYGEAYERAYLEKLKIDDALAALAAKLQPKKTILH